MLFSKPDPLEGVPSKTNVDPVWVLDCNATAWGAEEEGSHKDQANQGCIGSLCLKKNKR